MCIMCSVFQGGVGLCEAVTVHSPSRGALLAAAVHALCLHVDTSMQYEALASPVSLLRDFALLAHLHLLLSC